VPNLVSKPKPVIEITEDQKRVMRHFINAVAQAAIMHNTKMLTFEEALSDKDTPEHAKIEIQERLNNDYALLWDILEQLIDSVTEDKV